MRLWLEVGDEKLRRDLAAALRAAGHEVLGSDADEDGGPADAALVDLSREDALTRLRALRGSAPDLGLLAIGNDLAPGAALESRRAGADGFLRRPFDVAQLERALRSAGRRSARPPADPALVARDPRSRSLVEELAIAAESDATLLLHGPSGSGRTRLARFVHAASARADGPLVELDCGALAHPDGEARLFGRCDGEPGQLATAHGGTLLLEDVQRLPLALQGRLLHALQERRVRPIDGSRSRPVDPRVVATADSDLSGEVEAGHFVAGLRLRLAVLKVRVPPLSERREDLPELAMQFLGRAAREAGGPRARLDPEALAQLRRRPLPGNLHELEALMRRAHLLYRGVPLRSEDLETPAGSSPQLVPGAGFNLRSLEREAIACSLRAAGGNRTHAARALGISTRTLRNKLRRYELV